MSNANSVNFQGKVTVIPAPWANTVDGLVYDVFNGAQTRLEAVAALGLKSMAEQSHLDVMIEGGTVNSTIIGDRVPALGIFQELRLLVPGTGPDAVLNRASAVSVADTRAAAAIASLLTSRGSIIVRGGSAPQELPVGENSTTLMANTSAPAGVSWGTFTQLVERNPLDDVGARGAFGDIQVRTAAEYARLPLGINGQVLTVDRSRPQGVRWAPGGSGGGGPSGTPSPLTTKGDLYAYGSTDMRLPVGTVGQLLTADPATLSGMAWKTFVIPSLDSLPYDLNFSITGVLALGAVVAVSKLLRPLHIPAGFSGSVAEALVAPTTGSSRFLLAATGVGDLAHVDFAAGNTTGVFTPVHATPLDIPAGSILTITTDAAVFDGTIRNVCIGVTATATIV